MSEQTPQPVNMELHTDPQMFVGKANELRRDGKFDKIDFATGYEPEQSYDGYNNNLRDYSLADIKTDVWNAEKNPQKGFGMNSKQQDMMKSTWDKQVDAGEFAAYGDTEAKAKADAMVAEREKSLEDAGKSPNRLRAEAQYEEFINRPNVTINTTDDVVEATIKKMEAKLDEADANAENLGDVSRHDLVSRLIALDKKVAAHGEKEMTVELGKDMLDIADIEDELERRTNDAQDESEKPFEWGNDVDQPIPEEEPRAKDAFDEVAEAWLPKTDESTTGESDLDREARETYEYEMKQRADREAAADHAPKGSDNPEKSKKRRFGRMPKSANTTTEVDAFDVFEDNASESHQWTNGIPGEVLPLQPIAEPAEAEPVVVVEAEPSNDEKSPSKRRKALGVAAFGLLAAGAAAVGYGASTVNDETQLTGRVAAESAQPNEPNEEETPAEEAALEEPAETPNAEFTADDVETEAVINAEPERANTGNTPWDIGVESGLEESEVLSASDRALEVFNSLSSEEGGLDDVTFTRHEDDGMYWTTPKGDKDGRVINPEEYGKYVEVLNQQLAAEANNADTVS